MTRYVFFLLAAAVSGAVAQTKPAQAPVVVPPPIVPIVPAAPPASAQPELDIVRQKNGGEMAGNVFRRGNDSIELRSKSPSGAMISQVIPLTNVDRVTFAGGDRALAELARTQSADVGRVLQRWRIQSTLVDIPESYAGAYGIRAAQLLLDMPGAEAAKSASEILKLVESKDWDPVRRDRARALGIESLRLQGKQEEAEKAARQFLTEETSAESKAEASYYLALALIEDYRAFLEENPRWEMDPYMGPKRNVLYNEVLDNLLAPYLRYGAPPEVTVKSLQAATKFLEEFGSADEAAALAHDLVAVFPAQVATLGVVAKVAGDPAAILRQITDYSLEGVNRRLGPGYEFFHEKGPEKPFPEIWLAPVKEDVKGRRYEIGGPWTKGSGDFSSTQGQVLYVPDEKDNIGVDRVTIIEWTNGTWSEKPEPPWHGGFRPEPTSSKWLEAAVDGQLGSPIAMARGMGGWGNCGVSIFSSGLVATSGTVTAKGSDPTYQLPKNKIPTAVSVTNKNEFALVTVIDTDQMKGQVAVFAMESSGKETGFAHEWQDAYPGLPNVAVYTGMKLLGYIDLPGIRFPTGVSAVGSATTPRLNGRDGNAGMLREFNLADQKDRDNFYKGSNAGVVSRSGWAVVISKYDGKAAFIDLQPLFDRVREMYLTTEAKFQKTRDLGPAPNQWPYTFENDPSWAPKVVATVEQAEPTAVLASLGGGRQAKAFIASVDGKIRIYSVGGLGTEQAATKGSVKATGTVLAGGNPVCLAYQKGSNDTFLVVSRGEREIEWVRYTGNSGKIFRRMRDARLKDPVFLEVSDTHGVQAPVFTVADFKGRQILNYRYGPAVFATQGGAVFGMGKDGKDEFECGGILELPGYPFCISATNVN